MVKDFNEDSGLKNVLVMQLHRKRQDKELPYTKGFLMTNFPVRPTTLAAMRQFFMLFMTYMKNQSINGICGNFLRHDASLFLLPPAQIIPADLANEYPQILPGYPRHLF
ncbi:hypothetical protein Fmac_027976 [Flemingia macrophylla]|uniref:Uncharacterized protein n=1 Tax=Flemingia macrophylla TaxID=520843 RepID=A0ABD1LJC9_9FABA